MYRPNIENLNSVAKQVCLLLLATLVCIRVTTRITTTQVRGLCFATKKGCNSRPLLLSNNHNFFFTLNFNFPQAKLTQCLLLSNQQPKTTKASIYYHKEKEQILTFHYISLIYCCYSKSQMHHFSQFCFDCRLFISHSIP